MSFSGDEPNIIESKGKGMRKYCLIPLTNPKKKKKTLLARAATYLKQRDWEIV